MAEYLKASLAPRERLIYSTSPHWIVFLPGLCILFFALLIFVELNRYSFFSENALYSFKYSNFVSMIVGIFGLLLFLRALIFYATSEYGVTNRRVVMKTGWIQRKTVEIFLQRIEGITIDQSIWGRILNYGTLRILGTGGTVDYYANIPSPLKFHQIVQAQMLEILEVKSVK